MRVCVTMVYDLRLIWRPVLDEFCGDVSEARAGFVLPEEFEKVAVRSNQVGDDGMVNEVVIILAIRIRIRVRARVIHAILPCCMLALLLRPCQTKKRWMELGAVFANLERSRRGKIAKEVTHRRRFKTHHTHIYPIDGTYNTISCVSTIAHIDDCAVYIHTNTSHAYSIRAMSYSQTRREKERERNDDVGGGNAHTHTQHTSDKRAHGYMDTRHS